MISAIQFARGVTSGIDEGVLSRMLMNFREDNPGAMQIVKGRRGYQMCETIGKDLKVFLDDIGQLEKATNEVIKFASINKNRRASREKEIQVQGETISLTKNQERHVIDQMASELDAKSERIAVLERDLTKTRRALIVVNKVANVMVTDKDDIRKVVEVCNRLNIKPRIRISREGIVGISGVSA